MIIIKENKKLSRNRKRRIVRNNKIDDKMRSLSKKLKQKRKKNKKN